MGRTRWLSVTAGAAAVVLAQSFSVAADTNPQPVDFTHNVTNAPAPAPNTAFDMPTTPAAAGVAICTTTTSSAANVSTDCNDNGTAGPHNETSIAVNPTNPLNLIGGVNDYQLTLNPDGHLSESILSRAHVSFDGGKTWSMYGVFSSSTYQATGDAALAFDATGHAYYGTLGFRFVGPFNAQNPDVLVSNSGNGGKSWSEVVVAHGSGVETAVGDLLDKEYVTAWGAGNAIVTFGDFQLGKGGSVIRSFILASVTHDFGAHWTAPAVISGSDNEAFVSTPTRTANGRILVSYLNTRDVATGRDDVRVVEVNPESGAPVAGPFTVQQDIIDGAKDYPFDVDGRQTYQDSQFRTW
ncbi:MAG TPA: sialidase family protein, partial [Candidatus Acidoferrum sp.]|nr:sialidase family protein [Candidatus Acidoferrum sp.]